MKKSSKILLLLALIQLNLSAQRADGKFSDFINLNDTLKRIVKLNNNDYVLKYHESGKLKSIFQYNILKEKHGLNCFFYKNGQIKVIGYYSNNKKDGRFAYYTKKDRFKYYIYFKNGKKIKKTVFI